ncbi:MAG TPA: hypothetical protein VGB96_14340, partial [Archangium sp.]
MGDFFQTIVDKDVTEDEAPRLAEQVREWLVSRQLIEPDLADCALSEPGYRPGPHNGLQIQVGRTVFWTNFEGLTCR